MDLDLETTTATRAPLRVAAADAVDHTNAGRGGPAGAERKAGAAAQASAASPLGNTSELVQPPQVSDFRVERRRDRFAARALLWDASSLKAVRCCGRVIHGEAHGQSADRGVTIRQTGDSAGFGNLTTCGSVWSCPRCSAVIAAERAVMIGNAVRKCLVEGGAVYMLTLTMRHSSSDQLPDLWDGLSAAWRGTFGSIAWTGKAAGFRESGRRRLRRVGDAEVFEVAGLTRTVECTYGLAGWHLHVHALVFCAADSLSVGLAQDWQKRLALMVGGRVAGTVDAQWLADQAFAARVFGRWHAGLSTRGYDCGGVGIDLRRISDDGAEYIGRYLSKSTYDAAKQIGLEATHGLITKDGGGGNRTPFQVLLDISERVSMRAWGVRTPRHWKIVCDDQDFFIVDTDTHEIEAVAPSGQWRAWWQWEQASKGRRQVVWSKRRSAPKTGREELWNVLLDARGVEKTDEEIADEDLGGRTLGEIGRASWYQRMVFRPQWLAEALEAAEAGGGEGVRLWMAKRGVEWVPATAAFGRF